MSAQYKSGFVTLIGRPNVGKSTLMNQLVGQKLAIASNKPQTTRNQIRSILTTEEGQIVFVDTPGLHQAKNKLGEYMVKAAEAAFQEVEVILWIVEPDLQPGAGDLRIAKQMERISVPVVLVINKIDMRKPAQVVQVIDALKGIYNFAEIVPVSARTGENTKELLKVIFSYLKAGPKFYDDEMVTDQSQRQIVAEMIREKALHALEEEIPHGIAVMIEQMKERGKVTEIYATIICERESHKGIIIGKQGSMLKKIGTNARYEIECFLGRKVNLKLWIKVKKDWRDSEYLVKNFGYPEEK